MSKLHLVNQAAALADCIAAMQPEDSLLLCGNAVLQYKSAMAQLAEQRLYVLNEDCLARSLPIEAGAQAIEYAEFVALSCRHQQVLAW